MNSTLIDQKEFPAISIILPTHPGYPHFKTDREHMLGIIKNVEYQLSNQYSKNKTLLMMAKLNNVINRIDFTKLSNGLAIYVSLDTEKIIHLPFLVTSEKIIVDESFEIRDLIYAAKTDRNYFLALISQNKVKTFFGRNTSMMQVILPGMPENVKDVVNEHSFPGWDYLDTQAWDEKNIHNFIRFIDNTIEKELRQSKDDIIIFGDIKLISYFKKHTKIKDKIIAYIEGNYEHSNPSELLKLIQPIIENENHKENEYAMKLLAEAINHGNYSSGITEVWRASAEGRGRLLLVERDYRQKARLGNDSLTILVDDDSKNLWNNISDAVDDVMEQVLKNKGDIAFVENGTLKDHQRIVLVNRY